MKQYKVAIYQESLLGSLFLGQSKIDPIKFTNFLNLHAQEGYRVVTIEKEIRRMLLLFSREAMVAVLEKDI
ncbi:MAG: hypothetical protein ACD_4C00405G0003 [uncultured bacterium (gcode 4)]|uniref:DUF4177 domain-containing protein n=1 Tax=uncultured bacterium (gcode 4) TaxID=1234023 RepID=K2F529_9BACT|nr:MAG: hypothetical protein ACD_4C00405G0003 [uncultured bacterium (gcode 4)]